MRVLITRPEPDASLLAALCQSLGIETVQLPLLNIRFMPHDAAPIQPATGDKLIFVSKNAVEGYTYPPSENQCFAVGKSTALALQKKGFQKIIYPHPEQGAAALLALPEFKNVSGQRFIVIRGTDSLALIENKLAERGAEIIRLINYQTGFNPLTAAEITLLQTTYDFIVITSSNAMRYLAQLAAKYNPKLFNTPLSVLTENMLQSARNLGFTQPVIINSFENKDLYESLRYRKSGTHPRQ